MGRRSTAVRGWGAEGGAHGGDEGVEGFDGCLAIRTDEKVFLDLGTLVFGEALPKVLKLPFGARQNAGQDQAEGLTLFAPDGGKANDVLIVYDSTAPRRCRGASAVEADLFALP